MCTKEVQLRHYLFASIFCTACAPSRDSIHITLEACRSVTSLFQALRQRVKVWEQSPALFSLAIIRVVSLFYMRFPTL